MRGSGPGPDGPGPDPSAALETARRRLYAPGGRTPDAVAAYERLVVLVADARAAADAAAAPEAGTAAPGSAHDPAAPAGEPGHRRRGRRRALLAGLAVVVLAVALVATATRPQRPDRVALPALAGTTLFAYERAHDPATGPGAVTFQPEGYTLFEPRGRVVAVALRCVGEGTVRISAGASFDFRCGEQERTAVRRDVGPRDAPFVVVGTTVGDVVWAARVVALDPPQTAGAVPSFRGTCDACAAVAGG